MNRTAGIDRVRLCLLACLWFPLAVFAREPELEELKIETAAGHTVVYQVEVAKTPAQMQRGLMFRDTLPADRGMMFIYVPERPARMWMKNTILSLDMLFVDADGVIINIAKNTVPFSLDTIESGGPVRAVIELNAGQADNHQIAPGARVLHPLFEKE